MRMIQSSSNPHIQKVKKIRKHRKGKLFIVEGKKLFQEAISAGLEFEDIFVVSQVWAKEKLWLEPLEQRGASIYLIHPRLLKSISDMETPPGILGLAREPKPAASLSIARFAVFLASIRDPGNFGAILRAAEASGCEWVGYSSDCVDPFQTKVVRGSMGSLFRVPLVEAKDPSAFFKHELQPGVQVCGLVSREGRTLAEWRPVFPLIACIGSESHGLPEGLPLTEKISIPMKGQVESLNAAVAAAICLYWISFYAEKNV
jgi:RNA methyltransferase, TrmH family